MFKEIRDNKVLYIGWVAMILLILVGVATSRLLILSAFLLFGLLCVFGDVKHSFALLFGLLPFAHVFKLAPNTTSLFTICEIMVVLLAVIKANKISKKMGLCLLIFTLFMILADIKDVDALSVVKTIVGIYFIYLCVINLKSRDVVGIAYLLSGSTIATLLLSMVPTYYEYVIPYLSDLDYFQGEFGNVVMRMGGFLGDPNYCSALIIIIVNLLGVLYYHKMIKNEFWVFISCLIPLGFFTYSKSYFLCIVAFAVLNILFVLLPKHTGWAIIALVVVGVLVMLTLEGRFEVINVIFGRFSSSDITTGRSNLNEFYLKYIWENPSVLFFGEGINADRIYSAGNNVHNIYIEGLFKLGVVGFAIYLSSLWICVNAGKRRKMKKRIVNAFPLLFLVLLYSALAGITMYELPLYLSIAFLSLNIDVTDDNTIEKHIRRLDSK